MKLRLKNAKGIKAGSKLTWDGPDEIEIDFTGKTGLIALSGENGGGKTTCLESLSHFPQFVSRDGALWQGFMGRTAEKEFISTFMGHEYRSVIKMDSEQGKQEGYLWIDGKPTVNGKISAYKKAVEDIFGQPFTYFRSQFCPQKSKKTSEMQIDNMTPSVFRSLLREFLNLQRYDAWEASAKQIANHYQEQIAGISGKAAVLQAVVVGRQQADLDRCAAGDKVGFLQDEKTELQHSLEERRQKVDELKAAIQQNAVALERKKDLQQQIDRMETELTKEKQGSDVEIDRLSVAYRNIRNGISDCTTILASKDSIEKAAENVLVLTGAADAIQEMIDAEVTALPNHQQRVHEIETQLAQLRQQVKDLENDPENLRLGKLVDEAERAVKEKEKELRDLDNNRELFTIEAQISNCADMAKPLNKRGSLCPNPPPEDCEFIVGAIKAIKLQPDLEKKRAEIQEKIESQKVNLQNAIRDIKERTVAVLDEKGKLVALKSEEKRTLEEQIRTLTHDLKNVQQVVLGTTDLLNLHRNDIVKKRAEIAKQKTLADRLPEIKIAEQRKTDLERQLADVTAQGTEKKRQRAETEAAKRETIKGIRETQLAIVMSDAHEESLRIFLAGIEEIQKVKIPAVEKQIQEARDRMATLQAELRRIEAAEVELRDIEAQREALVRNMTSWRYLQFGCGKTGLPNLRIDGAAPRIVYNANRLLSQAYGALYSIRLETINDAGKEDLQIKIIMENGQEVYLDDVSGGQRQWLVQSLWLAMSLLNQEKSGRKYDYFCSDESDGSLDQDNADKYTALYRPFMADAGLDRFIFISHRESCRAAADHILQFEHQKNPVWA